ncbi:hypothetical protein [[Pseudomonas] boreopolis]|uniref:Uncharacterized protein n=1 Tax=Xanthomonas boreopolis TaxID=86183 RepID=A0A919F901_9XANT|nr:hypothetical protein GCM10009090_25320 [[Pseudomonas] boreopolis]
MSKVKLQDNLGRVVQINSDATNGATVGVNLFGPDGKVLSAADLGLGGSPTARFGWGQIDNVPRTLDSISRLAGMGFSAQIAPGDWRLRTLRASGGLLMRNGDGREGDPIVQMMPVIDSGDGAALRKVTIDAYGRVIATAAPTTDDLPEGGANLYFTDARADSRVGVGIANHVANPDPHPQYTTVEEAAAAAPVQSVVGENGDVTATQISTALGLGTVATHDAAEFVAVASLASLPNAPDDAAAAAAGVAVGAMYRNGSVLCVRIS